MEEDRADIKSLVKNAMSQESCGSWLLVIDNADDVELLFGTTALCDYLPSSPKGSILCTTRNHEVVAELDIPKRNIITAAKMTSTEALEMIQTTLEENQTHDGNSTTALLRTKIRIRTTTKRAASRWSTMALSRITNACESG